MNADERTIHVIGGGLAGAEAAWAAARAGVEVVIHEMRPTRMTDAHAGDGLAELVCSNSLRSDDHLGNAVGLLHKEMRRAGSLVMEAAEATRLPAGGALAVDREAFSRFITERIGENPLITVRREEIRDLPPREWRQVIIASGPLTSRPLADAIARLTGEEGLSFFDAMAPIIHADSIDMDICWRQSRYDKGGADYINCPMDKRQYEDFVNALLAGEKVDFRDWEKNTPYFDGCLPVEVMAARGMETLRHGPMKPRGLTNAHKPDEKPHAVVQLRQDNRLGTLYNMVGFQTKLTYSEQKRIFRTIPGLERARFARLGGLHRNTFLNSPKLLDEQLRLKAAPRLRFAGQITGVEGYVESAACGLMAGIAAAAEILGRPFTPPPPTSAHGALIHHVTGGHLALGGAKSFQPMNVNFGLFPPIETPTTGEDGKRLKGKRKTLARRRALCLRALDDFERWLAGRKG